MEDVQKSWFGRNWMWVVPTGGCLILMVLGIIAVGSLVFGVSKVIQNTEPYAYALEEALNNEELMEHLGDPIVSDGIMQGSMNYSNGEGLIDISIPVSGPKGKARIYIKGEKTGEEWEYEHLMAIIKKTSDTINLLNEDLDRFQ